MATIVERPMSALTDMQPSSQLSRRDSVEIIDVDSFDHLEGSSSQPQRTRPAPRPLQRRTWSQPETISLIDSDDEEMFFPQILSGHDVDRNRSHRQFISPPPPRTSAISNVLPPVPPIHPQYAGQTSLPMRRQPPPFPSPPVVPSTEPFSFEMSSSPPVAGPSGARRTTSRAAPVSHHLPPMALGGALISSNREQSILRHSRSAAAITRRRLVNRNPTRHIGALDFSLVLTDDEDGPVVRTYYNAAEDYETRQQNNWRISSREKEEYHQSYTHPPQPEPGFTFDFAPEDQDVPRSRFFPPTSIDEPIILDDDDDEGLSKHHARPSLSSGAREYSPAGKLDALLVCAKCLDPLILNAGLDPEEAQYRRVWGLRCGHLIDEKCLNELGQPQEEDQVIDRKGKGKARAMPKHTYGDAVPELQSLAEAEPPNIRSRLRSRVANALQSSSSNAAASSSSAFADAFADFAAIIQPAAKRRRVSNKKPKIQGEFEWRCPVANCGRVHVSVKIDGIWGPEKEKDSKGVKGLPTVARGAVAVFA